MTAQAYVVGALLLSAMLVPVIVGALRLRRRVLPSWAGAPAALIVIVTALTELVLVGEVLGTVGGFRRVPVAIGCLLLGGLLCWFGNPAPSRPSEARATPRRTPRRERLPLVFAIVGIASLAGEWSTRTIEALGHGLIETDTWQYHLPEAARFLQTGWTSRIQFTSLDNGVGFYPANAELLHGLAMLPFHRDILAPLLNLGWLALALLATWCIGARFGRAPEAVLAAVVVLASPILSATGAGTATNDVATAALLLASVAILLHGSDEDATLAASGLAAGLAIGTKVTAAVPVITLAVAVIIISRRARRARPALVWGVATFVGGGYWYLRNLARVGNPVPAIKFPLLPVPRLPVSRFEKTVAHYLGDGHFLFHVAPTGIRQALGGAGVLVVGLAALGAIAALVKARSARGQHYGLLAAVVVTGIVGYLITPNGAGSLPTVPFFLFSANVRYMTAPLIFGLAALAIVVSAREKWRRPTLAVLILLAAIAELSGTNALDAWLPAHRVPAVGIGLVVAGVLTLVFLGLPGGRRLPVLSRPVACGVATGAVLLVALVGFPLQRSYLSHRYRPPSPGWSQINALGTTLHHTRIAVDGYFPLFPLFGDDLSNFVDYLGDARSDGSFDALRGCSAWMAALQRGHFQYVVIGPYQADLVRTASQQWASADPALTRILIENPGPVAVYRISGDPDPHGQACASA